MRHAAVETSLQQPPATSVAPIKPSYCCLPGTSLLAITPIALLRTHLPPQPNTHSRVRGNSAHIARGFVPWRLSDAGHRAPGAVVHGRHPKPCTASDLRRTSLQVSFRLDQTRTRHRGRSHQCHISDKYAAAKNVRRVPSEFWRPSAPARGGRRGCRKLHT
jgi:hypothetical protein